ncbi:MAG: type IV pilin protein [Gemmatimonadota bacterium]
MRNQDGFTLIELLIAVAIIATLAAIVMPNFVSVKTKSFDGAAKADLRNMIVSQENYFSDTQAYTDVAVPPGDRADLDGNGTEDFRASRGVALGVTAYTDGFQITSSHNSSGNTWCVNSSGSASVAPGAIVKSGSC